MKLRTLGGNSYKYLYVLLVVVALVVGCGRGCLVNEEKAISALDTYGFSDITITNKTWMFVQLKGGSESDCVRFTAMATNPMGKRVKIYVFSGWPFKGATVRMP